MKERMALECIESIADAQYHKTGDKWWLKIGIAVARKLKERG